jgi:hypothetical protein
MATRIEVIVLSLIGHGGPVGADARVASGDAGVREG